MTAPPALLTRDFTLLLVATFAALSNYAPLMSVVPLWVADAGATGAAVGATTGVMMGATALTQLSMGALFRVLSLRQMLTAGTLVMGLATPAYVVSADLVPVLVVSGVRGVGFAMVVVAGSALVAELVPGRMLARGSGVYGLAAGLPSVLVLPAGVWLAQVVGFVPVFLGSAVVALVAVPLAWTVGGGRRHRPGQASAHPSEQAPGDTSEQARGDLSGQVTEPAARPEAGDGVPPGGAAHEDPAGWPARARATIGPLAAPATVFFATTVAMGGMMTFLPLALPGAASASAALFAMSLCMIAGRFAAGAVGDRLGHGRLLLPAAAVATVGMAGVALAGVTGTSLVAALAAGAFGIGLGAAQNDSLVVILNRAGPGRHGLASTVWNFAYDAGTGAGAVVLGVVVGLAGYPWAFAVAALAIGLTAPAARRSR